MPGPGMSVGGGVSRTGSIRLDSQPAPPGEWSAQWDAQVVDFDRDAFAKFIAAKGYEVVWEKAVMCPNVGGGTLAPRDHDIACPFCDGFGFIYVDPCETKMLVSGVRLDQAYYAYGRWDHGVSMVTALPDYTISYNDRLTLKNGRVRMTERLLRSNGTDSDRLKYTPLTVDYVAWVDRSKQLQRAVCGVAFEAENGYLVWYDGVPQPDATTYYSVAYTFRPRYVVQNLTHHHRVSTVAGEHYDFPVQAIAKLDFLVRDESKDDPQVVDSNPLPREISPFPGSAT